MRELTERALSTATVRGAAYADVRIVRRHDESIAIRTGRVEGVASSESEGFGIRVLVDGAWGFASSSRLEAAEIDRVAAQAVRIARASATALRDRSASTIDRRPTGRTRTPVVEDPFAIPLERKIGDGIAYTESMYAAQRERKTFAASDGSFTEQTITHVGAAVEANAIEGDEHQRRSYPDAGGGWNAAGYEYIRGLDLAGRAGPLAAEAVEAADRAAVPERPLHRHPRPVTAVPAGPRELWPSGRGPAAGRTPRSRSTPGGAVADLTEPESSPAVAQATTPMPPEGSRSMRSMLPRPSTAGMPAPGSSASSIDSSPASTSRDSTS
jgi:hypothetical protein